MIKNNDFATKITLPKFSDLYKKDEEYENFRNWNMYSMLHSTYMEEFNFIVYNCSHRVKEDGKIHHGSRVKIRFPKHSSYFIIFHGRLVHCGDEGIVDGNNYLKSARLFSYLRVPESASDGRRHTPRLRDYSHNIPTNTIDTSTFKMICHTGNRTCRKCHHVIDNCNTTIDLPTMISKTQNKTKEIIHVIGDINDDGWEVYEGYPLTRNFKFRLNEVLNKRDEFHGIGQTNRNILHLHGLASVKKTKVTKYKPMYEAFDNVLKHKLIHIPYLSNVVLDSKSIIANMGLTYTQIAHRDYSSIKKK